jgi:hypothetical protein
MLLTLDAMGEPMGFPAYQRTAFELASAYVTSDSNRINAGAICERTCKGNMSSDSILGTIVYGSTAPPLNGYRADTALQ